MKLSIALALACLTIQPLFARGITVELDYRPTSRDDDGAIEVTGIGHAPVAMGKVEDERSKQDRIGVNVEDDGSIPVRSRGSVEEFVETALREELPTLGLKFRDDAPLKLNVEVMKLFVEEDHLYKGEARLRVALLDSAGKEVFAGLVSGTSTRWGRSKSEENYDEVLSDSLLEAIGHLMEESGFRHALKKYRD